MNNFMRNVILLNEEAYGNKAIVYHRTGDRNNVNHLSIVNKIYEKGFKIGSGAMYGRGIYTTYDLQSQLQNDMAGTYGPIILKSYMNLYGFIILDYDVAKRVYGEKYKLLDQLEKVYGVNFNTKPNSRDYAKFITFIQEENAKRQDMNNRVVDVNVKIKSTNKELERQYKERENEVDSVIRDRKNYLPKSLILKSISDRGRYNMPQFSEVPEMKIIDENEAKKIYFRYTNIDNSGMDELVNISNMDYSDGKITSDMMLRVIKILDSLGVHINGVVYTGSRDGRCAVSYKEENVKPISYAFASNGATIEDIKWEKLPSFKTLDNIFNFDKKNKKIKYKKMDDEKFDNMKDNLSSELENKENRIKNALVDLPKEDLKNYVKSSLPAPDVIKPTKNKNILNRDLDHYVQYILEKLKKENLNPSLEAVYNSVPVELKGIPYKKESSQIVKVNIGDNYYSLYNMTSDLLWLRMNNRYIEGFEYFIAGLDDIQVYVNRQTSDIYFYIFHMMNKKYMHQK